MKTKEKKKKKKKKNQKNNFQKPNKQVLIGFIVADRGQAEKEPRRFQPVLKTGLLGKPLLSSQG